MNRSKNQNSALRTPLNELLGSKGHVKVLRKLTESEKPMSSSELLDRTTLSKQGVYDVVQRLVENGILKYVGSGKKQQVFLRDEHPLTDIIKKLFEEERKRYDRLIQSIKELIKSLDIEPKSAWISGKVAKGMDDYGDPIHISLLGSAKSIDDVTEKLRNQIYAKNIEKEYDITIDVRGLTLADLRTRSNTNTKDIILLWGYVPDHYLKESRSKENSSRTHQEFDQQSLVDAKEWSKLLQRYPEIIPRTIDYLNKKVHETNSGVKEELIEWRKILESTSLQRLKKFIESDSERATRLRQSLPFWPILTETERENLKKTKRDE